MPKRIKTKYPGIYYREANRIAGNGKEKVFYIVFKKNGKVIEEKVGRQYADDMTPARASGIRAERIEGKRLSRKEIKEKEQNKIQSLTIDQLWEKYKLTRRENKGLAIDSGRYGKYIKPLFGNKKVEDIQLVRIDAFTNKLEKKLSPQTIVHILNLITWIVNFGVKRNLCPQLPFYIEKPQVNNEVTEDLTVEQLANLLAAIEQDENIVARNMMKMALFTGMRRGEMFKLKWSHIDFNRRFLRIVDPKGGPDQKIPISDSARKVLKEHPLTEGSDYVFPGKNGGQRVTIRKPVNRIKKNAGLPKEFRPLHGLRHVYASMLASTGNVEMYTLQKLLTHKSPRMTQRYAHLRDTTLMNASNLAGDIINGATDAKGGNNDA